MVDNYRWEWEPTKEQLKIFKNWKTHLIGYLVACKDGRNVRWLLGDLSEHTGERVPLKEMGLTSVFTFLYELRDCIDFREQYIVFRSGETRPTLHVYIKESIVPRHMQHIRAMVVGQRDGKDKANTIGGYARLIDPIYLLIEEKKRVNWNFRAICNHQEQQSFPILAPRRGTCSYAGWNSSSTPVAPEPAPRISSMPLVKPSKNSVWERLSDGDNSSEPESTPSHDDAQDKKEPEPESLMIKLNPRSGERVVTKMEELHLQDPKPPKPSESNNESLKCDNEESVNALAKAIIDVTDDDDYWLGPHVRRFLGILDIDPNPVKPLISSPEKETIETRPPLTSAPRQEESLAVVKCPQKTPSMACRPKQVIPSETGTRRRSIRIKL